MKSRHQMKSQYLAMLLALCAVPLMAQTPAPAADSQMDSDGLGFNYSMPAGWETVPGPPPAAPSPDVIANPKLAIVKKGTACVQVVFTAKHGTPASVVVIVALPFACYGQTMEASDLPGF